MDALTAALVAAGAAWLSILAAAHLPSVRVEMRPIRWAGGASLALLGLATFGLGIPPWVPVAVLAVGVAGSLAWPRPAPASL